MKTLIASITFILASTAMAAPGRINHVVCSAQNGAGLTTVAYTGGQYFNISNIPVFGFAFTQQAKIESVDLEGDSIVFTLRGMITGGKFSLELKNQTREGHLSTQNGSMPLTCSADVQVL